MVYVLGLDISTSIAGACLISSEESTGVLFSGASKISNLDGLHPKATEFRLFLERIKTEFGMPQTVVVEEALQRFTGGLSSSRTISTLMRFNGAACYVAQEVFGIEPLMANVNAARKELGISIPKGSKDVKQQVLRWAQAHERLSNIKWPMKQLRGGPRRGEVVEDESCYDIADAAVMALYGLTRS